MAHFNSRTGRAGTVRASKSAKPRMFKPHRWFGCGHKVASSTNSWIFYELHACKMAPLDSSHAEEPPQKHAPPIPASGASDEGGSTALNPQWAVQVKSTASLGTQVPMPQHDLTDAFNSQGRIQERGLRLLYCNDSPDRASPDPSSAPRYRSSTFSRG